MSTDKLTRVDCGDCPRSCGCLDRCQRATSTDKPPELQAEQYANRLTTNGSDTWEYAKRDWLVGHRSRDEAFAALNARIAQLELIVFRSGTQFHDYAELHRAKGTADGNRKADINEQFAVDCFAALSGEVVNPDRRVREGDRAVLALGTFKSHYQHELSAAEERAFVAGFAAGLLDDLQIRVDSAIAETTDAERKETPNG